MANKKKKLTSDKIAESIFDASSIIAEAKMKNLAQDKTYKATVVGTSRAGEGLYSCKLDELIFTAVGGINEYKVDDIVQVNVPQDNWDNQKNIIGKGWVSESAGDATMPFDNFYVPGDEDFKNPFWSTSTETHLIANAEAKLITEVADAQEPPSAAEAVETSAAITNGTFLYDAYDKAYTTLGVRAKFCTKNLVNFPVLEGNYGLRLELFADSNSVLPLATYELNALNITGNVYALLDYTEFEALFKMDTSVLANLKSAKLSLFQNGQFYQMDGNTLESDFLRYDEGVFDENTNSRAKPSENISIKDIQLFWGYDARDFETDNLKLSCTSSLYYRARDYNETKDKVFKYNYIVKDKNNRLHEVNDAEPSLWYRIGTTEWVKSSATLHKETQTFEQEISDPQMNSAANSISFKARIEKENYNDETGEKYEYIDSNVVTLQKKTDGTEKDKADAYDPETGKDKSNEQEGEGGNANIINYITEAPDFKNDKPHLRREWLDALGIVLAQGEHHEIHSNELTVTRMMHDPVGNPIDTDIETLPLLATVDYYFLGSALHGQITLASPVGTNNQVLEERPYTDSTDQNPKRRDLIKISGQALRQLIPPNAGAMYDPNEHSIGCFYFGDIESTNCGSISDIRIVTETVTVEREGEEIEEVQVKEINGFICNNLGPKRMDNILINHPFNYTISDTDLIGGACDHHNTYMSGQIAHNTSTGNLDGCNVAFGYNNIAKSAADESQGNYQTIFVTGRNNEVEGFGGTTVLGVYNINKSEHINSVTAGNHILGSENTLQSGKLGNNFILGRNNTSIGQHDSQYHTIGDPTLYDTITIGSYNCNNCNNSILLGEDNAIELFTEKMMLDIYPTMIDNGYNANILGYHPVKEIDGSIYPKRITSIDILVSQYQLYRDAEYTEELDGSGLAHSIVYCKFNKKFYYCTSEYFDDTYHYYYYNIPDASLGSPYIFGKYNNLLSVNNNINKATVLIGNYNLINIDDRNKSFQIFGNYNQVNDTRFLNSGTFYLNGMYNLLKQTSSEGYINVNGEFNDLYRPANIFTLGTHNQIYDNDYGFNYGEHNKLYLSNQPIIFGQHNIDIKGSGLINGDSNINLSSKYTSMNGLGNSALNSSNSFILGKNSLINLEKSADVDTLIFNDINSNINYELKMNPIPAQQAKDIFNENEFVFNTITPEANTNYAVIQGEWNSYYTESSTPSTGNYYQQGIVSAQSTHIYFYDTEKFIAWFGDTLPSNRESIVNYFLETGNTNEYNLYVGTSSTPATGINGITGQEVTIRYLITESSSRYSLTEPTYADSEYGSAIFTFSTITPEPIVVVHYDQPLFDYIKHGNEDTIDTFIGQWESNQWNKVGYYDIPSAENAAIIGQHDIGYGSDFFVTGKYNRNYGDNSTVLGSVNYNNSVSSFITGYGNINGDRTSVYTNQAIEPAMSGISSYYYNPYDRKFYVNPHNGSVDPQIDTPVQGDPDATYQDKTYVDGNNNSIINIPYKYNSTLGEWQIDLFNSRFTNDGLNYLGGVGNYIYGGTKFNYIQGAGNQIIDGARHCVIFGVNNKIGAGSSHVYITGEGHVLRNTTYNYDIHADYCNISGSYSDLVSLSGWSSPFAPIEVVGNGSENARSNARVLYKDGNETLAGILTVGAQPTSNNHVATKKYVDDAIAASPAGSPVSWNQIQTSTGATKIAEITIGQTTTDVYAPTGGGAQFTDVTGTLTTGQTSITLSDAAILTTSTFDFYTDTFGVSPTAVSVATGSITLTFAAQANNLGVKVRVW